MGIIMSGVAGKPIEALSDDRGEESPVPLFKTSKREEPGGFYFVFPMAGWTVITFSLISSSPLTRRGHHGNVCGPSWLDENGFVLH